MTTQTDFTTEGAWRPADTLAARVFLTRRELHLSQRQAADRAGIGLGTWQGLEDGRHSRDLPTVVTKIAAAFGVDRDWLMWGGALGTGYPSNTSGWSSGNSAVVDTYATAA
jgi:transcriptional regulator with XRE-family HTH domain